jgi:hypothetical protein
MTIGDNSDHKGVFKRLFNWLGSWRHQPPDFDRRRVGVWPQLSSIEALAFRGFSFVVLFIAIYAFAQAKGTLSHDAFKIFGILLGETVAAAAFGGFLGFLFGIPRLLQQAAKAVSEGPSPSPALESGKGPSPVSSATRRFLSSNTNLEEISDWLTKIIVGISLVQASTIIAGIRTAANIFQSNALPDAQGADVMFVFVLIAASVVGFLFFYMETRTRVTILFTDIEMVGEPILAISDVIKPVLDAPIAPRMSELGAFGTDGPPTGSPAPISEDRKVLSVPYESLKTVDELAAWASAQARANNFSAAVRALQDAIAKEPKNSDLLLRLAAVQQRRGNARAVYDVLSEARYQSKDDPNILKEELLASLYLNPPESFQKAIPITERLTAMSTEAKDSLVWVWTAAAQGQRYRWLRENNGVQAEKTDAREKALNAVAQVVRLETDPGSEARTLLRQLFDPEKEKSTLSENDLEVFKGEKAFEDLIYGAPPVTQGNRR